MNKIESQSFDNYFLFRKDDYVVVEIFKRTVNLSNSEGEILTLTERKGVLKGISLKLHNLENIFKIGDMFFLNKNILIGNKIAIILDEKRGRDFDLDLKKIDIKFFENNLDKFLDNQYSQGIIQVLKEEKNLINQFLFEKINHIDKNCICVKKFSEEIKKLYSAGIGSTPSMDDVILGMIIAAKTYGDSTEIFKDTYEKTTFISKNMLLGVLENKVSDNVKKLYENKEFHKIEYLTKEIGSSSGIDMLVGTYFYFKKRRGEFCLKN